MKKININITARKIFLLTVAAAISVLFFPPVTVQAEPTVTLTYANFPPASTFACVQMEKWKEEIEIKTNGAVKINTFPNGTLLSAKNMINGVINGQADIGCLCMAYQPGRFMVTNALSLPFGFKNAKSGTISLIEIFKQYNPEEFKNVKVIGLFTTAPANIYSKKPITTLKDLEKIKLRASGGIAQVITALGGQAVGMPQSDTPEAIQKGVVDGAVSSLETLMDLNYSELCREVTILNGPVYPFAVVMNLKKYNSLPNDIKKIFDDFMEEHSMWTADYMDAHVEESVSWSKEKYNIVINQFGDNEITEINKRVEILFEDYVKDTIKDNIPGRTIISDIYNSIELQKTK